MKKDKKKAKEEASPKSLSDLSNKELKALAYDLLVQKAKLDQICKLVSEEIKQRKMSHELPDIRVEAKKSEVESSGGC
jgi:molybdate-binding protein